MRQSRSHLGHYSKYENIVKSPLPVGRATINRTLCFVHTKPKEMFDMYRISQISWRQHVPYEAFVADESGATAIEYGLIAAGISVAIIGIVNGIGDKISAAFTKIETQIK